MATKRAPKRKPFTRAELNNQTIRQPDGSEAEAYIVHTVETNTERYFTVRPQIDDFGAPYRHHFAVYDDGDYASDLTEGGQYTHEEIAAHEVAYLDVDELPAHMVQDWAVTMDMLYAGDGDGLYVEIGGAIARKIEEDDYDRLGPETESALIGGSLFIYKMLAVRPEYRRNQTVPIGARLMAHALATLSRTCNDLSVCVALPEKTKWEKDYPPTDSKKLVAHYKRLGWSIFPGIDSSFTQVTPLIYNHALNPSWDPKPNR